MFDRGEAVRRAVLNVARYTGVAPLLSGPMGGIGVILMLHRVTRAPCRSLGLNRHLAVTPSFLDEVVAEMKRLGYSFVTMDEMVAAIRRGERRPRHATITFDDAYRDNLHEAAPVLQRHGAPFTVYVSPGLIDGTADLWWDVLEAIVTQSERVVLPTAAGDIELDCSTVCAKAEANRVIHDYVTSEIAEEARQPLLREMARRAGVDHREPSAESLMDWDEVRATAAHPLGTLGAHTINHYNLRRLSADSALTEMSGSARILAEKTGATVRHFAYPYGYESAVGAREVQLARTAGFESAVTTRHGVIQPGHAGHLHALPRISMNGRYQDIAHVRTMLSGLTTLLANSGRRLVTV